jgi:diguanylate cyclase (GGDEF)-like protein
MCVLANNDDVSRSQAIAQADTFKCEGNRFNSPAKHYWISAQIADITSATTDPVLRIRIARQDTITLIVNYADAPSQERVYGSDDIKANWRAPSYVSLNLNGPNGEIAESILVGVDRPWDPWNLADMNIMSAQADLAGHNTSYLANAVFCALLMAPLILHLGLFMVLRIRFIMIHVMGLAAIIITQLLWSGIAFDLVPFLSVNARSVLAHMSIALLMCVVCLLIRDICEPEKLGPRISKALLLCSITMPAIALTVLALSPRLPMVGSLLFHAAVMLCVVTVVISLLVASIRGSWTARGLCFATIGFVIVALSRIINSLGIFETMPSFDHGFFAAAFIDAVVMSVIVISKALHMRRQHDVAMMENAVLFKAARIDPLTQLLNRRALEEDFQTLIKQSERRSQVSSIFVIDIDHFKTVNDTFGHDGGDLCLKQMSAIFQQVCRIGDSCARIGGEEFVILATTPNIDDAMALAERIRDTVSEYNFGNHSAEIGRLTVSIGLARIPRASTTTLDEVFHTADKALYAAKQTGRNRVVNAAKMPDVARVKKTA